MRRVGSGDRAALTTLIERHQSKVLALAYRFLGRWDLAEDAAQDVFIRVLRSAAEFRPEARFTTWLYRLVANLCWDRRRRAVRELRQRRAQLAPGPIASPTAAVEAQELADRVRRTVAELPDRQRLAVVLHRFEGLSHREIAEATGWGLAAVESCLVRAYEGLRRSLSDVSIGPLRPTKGTKDFGREVSPLGSVQPSVQPMWGASDEARATDRTGPTGGE